jgi:hypothetical protein
MPISDVSRVRAEKFISAAEAVDIVMNRFRSCGCTTGEVCAWLSGQVRDGKLNLRWTDKSPEGRSGKALYLTGEDRILVPGYPQAWAVDTLDWTVGELRRRLRIAMFDMARLTPEERLAFDGPSDRRERGTAELRYGFRVALAELIAILDSVAVPRSEAGACSTRDQEHGSYSGVPIGVEAIAQIKSNTSGLAGPTTVGQSRKADPRNKSHAMLEGLERALTSGVLTEGERATLKAAHQAMLDALGHKDPPTGMGVDAFAKHCKLWLKQHGIYT